VNPMDSANRNFFIFCKVLMINVFDLKGSDNLFRNVLTNDLSQDLEPGKHK